MPSFEILVPITSTFHWELGPFFYLFRKFWGQEQEVTILSNADPQIPLTRFVPIRDSIGNDWDGEFSNNLAAYLINDCQADYVVILMGDYWLTEEVYLEGLYTLIEFMVSDQQVVRLQISPGMDDNFSRTVQYYKQMEIRDRDELLRGSLIPGLWSRELLIKCLQPHLNIWATEVELSKEIDRVGLKSLLTLPDVFIYSHIARTSSRVVDLQLFPETLKEEVRRLIPEGYNIYG